jgi:hypothetical protein
MSKVRALSTLAIIHSMCKHVSFISTVLAIRLHNCYSYLAMLHHSMQSRYLQVFRFQKKSSCSKNFSLLLEKHQILSQKLYCFCLPLKSSSEFDVLSISNNVTRQSEDWSNTTEYEITITIVLQRHSIFYIFVFILPSYVVISMSILGIFTPTTTEGFQCEKV